MFTIKGVISILLSPFKNSMGAQYVGLLLREPSVKIVVCANFNRPQSDEVSVVYIHK